MSCNCLSTVLNEAKQRATQYLVNPAPASVSASWVNAFNTLQKSNASDLLIGLPVKLDCTFAEGSSSSFTHQVFMSFCPFCGESMDSGGMQDAG